MKFKAKRTGRRTSTRVVISGDERDPQGIWDRILGFFSNIFAKLFGKIEIERTVMDPDEEIELEGTAEELKVVKEASEGSLRTMIQGSLAAEAVDAEKKKLAAGHDPQEPMAGTPEEQMELMRALQEFTNQKLDEGYSIDLRKIIEDDAKREKLDRPISDLGLSKRVTKVLTSARLRTVHDLVTRGEAGLIVISGFGTSSLREVKGKLAEFGVELGTGSSY